MKESPNFYKLLCLNSKDEVKNFLIENGKGPKAVCPVIFDVDKDEKPNNEEE